MLIIPLFLYVLGLVCFLLSAIGVASRVNLESLGLFCFGLGFVLGMGLRLR